MFKPGQQVGIQNARLYNGHGVVEAYVNVGERRKLLPAKWNTASGEVVIVRCADGKARRYSNGDIVKVVSLEGKTKEELKAFGIGTTLHLPGSCTLRGVEGTEVWKRDHRIEVTSPGLLEIDLPYTERSVADPSDDDPELD